MKSRTVFKYLCTTRTLELDWNYLHNGRFVHLIIGINIIVILSYLILGSVAVCHVDYGKWLATRSILGTVPLSRLT